jgi:hypothetical protein
VHSAHTNNRDYPPLDVQLTTLGTSHHTFTHRLDARCDTCVVFPPSHTFLWNTMWAQNRPLSTLVPSGWLPRAPRWWEQSWCARSGKPGAWTTRLPRVDECPHANKLHRLRVYGCAIRNQHTDKKVERENTVLVTGSTALWRLGPAPTCRGGGL